MKIKGTCSRCGKDFLAEQLAESHGHCPWCGLAFSPDYTSNLTKALQSADVAGDVLEDALEQIADLEPKFELDEDAVLEPLREALRSQRRRHARA
jgi:hypothetical protein